MPSDGPIAIRTGPGKMAFLRSTAMGKVLLAGMSDDVARATMRDGPGGSQQFRVLLAKTALPAAQR